MLNTAIILAAGRGSRLGNETSSKPKGLVALQGSTLIDISVSRLRAAGIKNIFIVTGYLFSVYESHFENDPNVQCITNSHFDKGGSALSLVAAQNVIKDDFLLLESDLLYESRALELLINNPYPNLILTSGYISSHDEVFVETDLQGTLTKLSKDRHALATIAGEFTGINKLSRAAYQHICSFLQADMNIREEWDYEDLLVATANDLQLRVITVDDLLWCEIDDSLHYQHAVNTILPKINSKLISS